MMSVPTTGNWFSRSRPPVGPSRPGGVPGASRGGWRTRPLSVVCASVLTAVAPAAAANAAAVRGHEGFRPDTTQSETLSTLSNSAPSSLRAAIDAANSAAAGTATDITFTVHGTITLASALPAPVVEINCGGYAGLRFFASSADSELLGGTASKFLTFNTFGGLLAFKGAAPNGNDGLLFTSTGGHIVARTNVFSGNAENGIELADRASGVTVDPNIVGLDNYIGLDRFRLSLPNSGEPVVDTGQENLVRGNVTQSRGRRR